MNPCVYWKLWNARRQNEHSGNLPPPPKTNMTLEIPMFNIGNTSSNGGFSIVNVTVVFEDVKIPLSLHHPHAQLLGQTLCTGFRFRIITETLHGWRLGGKMAETHVVNLICSEFPVKPQDNTQQWSEFHDILKIREQIPTLDHLPFFGVLPN